METEKNLKILIYLETADPAGRVNELFELVPTITVPEFRTYKYFFL